MGISSYRGEYIVNSAAIKRMLSKHQSQLMIIYNILARENNPYQGVYLERLWHTLFLGAHYDSKCLHWFYNGTITQLATYIFYLLVPTKLATFVINIFSL